MRSTANTGRCWPWRRGWPRPRAYGDFSAPDSPAAGAHAAITARNLAAEGAAAMLEGDFNQAGEVLARALMTDGDNAEALANLGVLLRRAGRLDAAALCWMRASDAGPASRANLANVLRELGQLSAAEAEFVAALAADPANPALLYGLGRLKRQCGHAREAVALLERAEELRPGTVPPRELATALLKSGDLARGLTELPRRPTPRQAWVDAAVWDGSDLEARSILVRDDDDAIETVILARFIPQIARCGGLVVVECVPELARLMAALPGVEQVVPRGADLPPVDVVTRLADVPRLIGLPSRNAPPRDIPYLRLPDGMAPHGPAGTGKLRVGIAWSGRATDQAVPLSLLLQLAADPRVALVSLQRGPRADELAASGAAPFVDDLGRHCADLADSAAFIAGLDLVVAADTAEAHVAAAMGKPVWLLLPATCDWHVVDNRDDSVWYPTMRVFRQAQDGSWTAAAARMLEAARVVSAAFSQE
ncbi:MAG TPA: tetratricopeptide repeat protein [Magnetospirillum sp.]|nr:tetratricopeptide repeat protein [Magnetospirillum sp.]